MPTSICKHSQGVLQDGWHWAGATGKPEPPWRAPLAQGFRTPSLFARRDAGASRPTARSDALAGDKVDVGVG